MRLANVCQRHALRHTHASLLVADGVAIKVVSERLGHAHPAFTMHTYPHNDNIDRLLERDPPSGTPYAHSALTARHSGDTVPLV